MKRYTVSEARKQIAAVLDGAEGGEAVLIERDGVRFRVIVEPKGGRSRAKRAPVLTILDSAVEKGAWTWAPRGRSRALAFKRK